MLTSEQLKKMFKREVYRNLHFRDEVVYSVLKGGLVEGHALCHVMDGVTFSVGPKGNHTALQRVTATRAPRRTEVAGSLAWLLHRCVPNFLHTVLSVPATVGTIELYDTSSTWEQLCFGATKFLLRNS